MRALALASLAVVAGCSTPSLAIELEYDALLAGHVHPATGTPPVVTVRVRAIDADQAVTTWPRGDEATGAATCDELMFARIPPEVLDAATVASARDGAPLLAVPRLGIKLIIAEAFDDAGRRIGVGCEDLDDVEQDTRLVVPVETAARVVQLARLVGQDNLASQKVDLIAIAPWRSAAGEVPLVGRAIEIDRFHRDGRLTPSLKRDTLDGGFAEVGDLLAGAATGPVQALIRVRGASEPLRVGVWKPWARVSTAGGLDGVRFTVAEGTHAAGAAGLRGEAGWMVAVTYRDPALVAHLIVVEVKDGALSVREVEVPQPGLGAPVLWNRMLYVVNADGWRLVEGSASGFRVGALLHADAGPPAIETIVVPACSNDAFMLVRRAPGALYHAYGKPGERFNDDAALVAAIGGGRVVSSVCVSGDAATSVPLLLVAALDGGLRVVRPGGGTFAVRGISAMNDLNPSIPSGPGLVAYLSHTGPRARSFRFANLGGMLDRLLVPTDAIDVPLATAPTALAAAQLDGDAAPDLVALLPTPEGLRLQAVLDDIIDGQPLTATSEPLVMPASAAARARMIVVDADGHADDPRDEIVVLSDAGIVVFDP